MLCPARRFTVVRQHLRGAADAAPKGFVKGDAAKLPPVAPAVMVDVPLSCCAPDTLMRTFSRHDAKPIMRFASP
jgi:hypothetical protein